MFTEAHPFVGTWHVIALLKTHMGKYASDGKDEYKHRNGMQGLFKKKKVTLGFHQPVTTDPRAMHTTVSLTIFRLPTATAARQPPRYNGELWQPLR